MQISSAYYTRFAWFFGLILFLYGAGSIINYAVFVFSGTNNLSDFTNGMGVLFLGLMGAVAFPLSVAIFLKGEHKRLLLVITAVALGINAIIRLSVVAVPELRDMTGRATPITEFFIFSALAAIAFVIRPRSEAPDQN